MRRQGDMTRGIRMRIDRSAFKHNLRRVRELAPDSRVMAVVKCDGYGHGLVEAARGLRNPDAFAVESLEEALRLRETGFRQPVVLLTGFHGEAELDTIAFRRFCPVVHHQWQIDALARAQTSFVIGVWVKVDSGMHRVGFLPSEVPGVLSALENMADVRIEGLMSHLASADDLADAATRTQYKVFTETAAGRGYPLSLANSPGVLEWPITHLDWVRPGMMLYGCSPVTDRTEQDYDLRPVMTLESKIVSVKTIPEGGAIGYGGTWVCEAPTRVGVLMCGYGDGYPRHAPSGTPVWAKGQPSRVLGRISMDLMTVDLDGRDDVDVGDWVELWGKNVPASVVAAHAGTIPYELVTRVTRRVPRVYEN